MFFLTRQCISVDSESINTDMVNIGGECTEGNAVEMVVRGPGFWLKVSQAHL